MNPPNDPILNEVYNDGLEWAAVWIETSASSDERVRDFAASMVMSIRAAKRPAMFQQDFFEAIRNDPYMAAEDRAYWLSKESLALANGEQLVNGDGHTFPVEEIEELGNNV
jgi:hypothetical protein